MVKAGTTLGFLFLCSDVSFRISFQNLVSFTIPILFFSNIQSKKIFQNSNEIL